MDWIKVITGVLWAVAIAAILIVAVLITLWEVR